jgi:hypothetical protein
MSKFRRKINKKERSIAMLRKKQIPNFKNEDEERAFWDAHDSTEYVDWTKGKRVTSSNLKPSTNADECQS